MYEEIGAGYAGYRRIEPTWQRAISRALGPARSVVNVGAGTGSYEPHDRPVVAVEPSEVMLGQRPPGAAVAVRAIAESLPFGDGAFGAALAVLTVHHWSDAAAGLAEMRRVADRQAVVTWDPKVFARSFWFARDYMPEALEREAGMATLDAIVAGLPASRTEVLDVPADCADGFFAAYWRRPEAYLDPRVQAAISAFALLPSEIVKRATANLARDLADGAWNRRYGDLLTAQTLDVGYRLVSTS